LAGTKRIEMTALNRRQVLFLTLAVRDTTYGGGALVAEVNLKFIWDVVSRIQVGKSGYAYVVDSSGELIAHPHISAVVSTERVNRARAACFALRYRLNMLFRQSEVEQDRVGAHGE
jgi:hypothetical protein